MTMTTCWIFDAPAIVRNIVAGSGGSGAPAFVEQATIVAASASAAKHVTGRREATRTFTQAREEP